MFKKSYDIYMKQLIVFLISIFLCWEPAAAAEGLMHRPGEWNIGVGLKTSTPGLGTDWGEFNVLNYTTGVEHDAKPGITSGGFDIQILYFLTEWLAGGLSFGDEYFDYDVASGINMDVDTRVNNFLALVRIFLNPSQKYKWYIPLAVGLGHVMTGIDMQPEESFHYTGFSGHIGLGLERFLNEHWSLAAELRYNHNQFHNTQTNARGENYRVYPKLNYFSLSVRTDYRF